MSEVFENHRRDALADIAIRFEIIKSTKPESYPGWAELEPAGRIIVVTKILDALIEFGGVSKFGPLLWDSVCNHLPALSAAWRQSVRTSIFGARDLGGFSGVWDRFSREIFQPIVFDQLSMLSNVKKMETAVLCVRDQQERIFLMLDEVARAGESDTLVTTDPLEYEVLCAAALAKDGWNARATPSGGDQGVDVIATKGAIKIVIQCKLYSKPVGNKAVQEIVGARGFERAHAAAVVANVSFTRSATDLAAMNGVALIHHDQLVVWAAQVHASLVGSPE